MNKMFELGKYFVYTIGITGKMEFSFFSAIWALINQANFTHTLPADTNEPQFHGVPMCQEWNSSDSERLILQKILKNYHRDTVPTFPGVEVEVELVVQSISQISEISSSFTIDILFSQVH